MRLTLRTLLAYLDGILEPNDAQDIGKKIEESEFATSLVHRIRDVMRRLRLGAPSLAERSPRVDANTVAEYLDNTLASEGVADFEKVCLDSDVHLAEVASCHQILTLVLGEPAEIDPASRQQMYQLKDVQAGAEPPVSPPVGPPPVAPSTSTPPSLDRGASDGESAARRFRPKPTVPEYLRELHKRPRWLPTAAAVVLVACFTMVVLMALGQFEPGTPLGDALVRWGVVVPPQGLASGPEAAGPTAGEDRDVKDKPVQEPITESAEEPIKKPIAEPVAEPVKEPSQELAPELGEGPTSKPTPESSGEPASKPAEGDVVEPKTATELKIVEKPEAVPAVPRVGLVEEPGKALPGESAVEMRPKSLPSLMPKPDIVPERRSKPPPEPSPLPPEPLGRLMSSDRVLLKDDPATGWLRVAANQMLMPQRLLALPTYRAKVTLTIGVTLEILGGTQLELLPSSPRDLPGIRIHYGRVVLMPLAKAGSRLRVTFGSRTGVLTFPDAESVAALEVRRVRVPGTNPEAEPPHIVANLYATTGSVLWEEADAGPGEKKMQLMSPQWVSFNGDLTSEPVAFRELPRWIVAEPISPLDRRASPQIAQALPTDRLARLGLLELSASRPQKEVKWLALRCLGYIGQYHDMVAMLNDPARKLDWPDYIDQLREAVGRDSESAAAVRLALEKQYPQQAAELYRMLWGYTDKDLQGDKHGEDANLVKALDDETLAARVLAFWNLKDLTGLGLFYKPEQTAAKRQQPMLRWKQRLEAQEIRLKTPEEKAGAAAEENSATPPAPESGK